jgi:hypothetical protein
MKKQRVATMMMGFVVGCAPLEAAMDASRDARGTDGAVAIDARGSDGQGPLAPADAAADDAAEDALDDAGGEPALDVGSAPMDAVAPRDAATDAVVRADARPDGAPSRPSGIPSWVVYTPTGGGVAGPIGVAPPTTPPRTTREERVSSTIVLRAPGVYDFANVMHRWSGSGRCIQLENQPPILHIAGSNITVRNFAYINAPDGIHIGAAVGAGQGYNPQPRIENIVLDNVSGYACEDALTTQHNTWNISILNSWFHGNPNAAERDKLLQLNFANNLRIAATTFVNSPRCVRFKGGARILIERSVFDRCSDAVRGDTIDTLGAIPRTASEVTSRRSTYRGYTRTFSAIGMITIYSEQDELTDGRRHLEESGGRVIYR